MKTRIAIACQGGGSQTAFTAGALHALFDAGIQNDFDIVSLSGTSGGAVCAALIWYAMKKGEQPVSRRLLNFWNDIPPRSADEQFFNDWVVHWIRAINSGNWPALQLSPTSLLTQIMMGYLSMGKRRSFVDFTELLNAHIDFDEIAAWGPLQEKPVLLMGAANVLTGRLRKFVSRKDVIRVDHILASCAVPSIFPAVKIENEAYWDGLFSDNPPIDELIRPAFVGADNIAQEIWLIKINPTYRDSIPSQPQEIFDRRNQLEGNISLFQQLSHLEMLNDLLLADAFREEFLHTLSVKSPVRIPKSFRNDPDKPYHIPCIEISESLQRALNYESKIDRGSNNIDALFENGQSQAREFLAARAQAG
ncbi:hypothetical protein WS97_30190 [Burkholderia territorii]|uniref:patatin-like phospholipase family protein n=1 Tax=Burkholderia territorii TaxID=1503055 RepID=UPI0007563313|nr:patatin-like phospholipase family protein [Burkholderia territorii]KVL25568.1 hypothetical protein WS97_30190 [Burkholderia territorii]